MNSFQKRVSKFNNTLFFRFSSIFVVFALSFVVTSTVHAVEYGGVGGRPANPVPGNSRTDSIFVHTVEPGTTSQDAVKVLNNSSESKVLEVYAVDSVVSSGGAFACAQAVDEKKDVGSWINLSLNEVSLEPLSSQIVPFGIKVPNGADVGEHNGCIIIQEKKSTQSSIKENGIQLSFRTGLRVALLVPGNIVRNLEFGKFELSKKLDGSIVLHPTVKNTGNVSIDADVFAVTRYFFGKTLQTNGGEFPVLRDQSSEWNFVVPKTFWGGLYRSSVTVTYDKDLDATVGRNTGKSLSVLQSNSLWFFVWPTVKGGLIEFVVLVLILFLIYKLWRRAKTKRVIKKTWVNYVVRSGDTVNSIAAGHDISWKLLANANKLRPPYDLNPGSTVIVPPTLSPDRRTI